jgi:hypothetical protein
MNKLIDISNWQSGNNNLVPIGKRIKKVVFDPENEDNLYYFKEPKEKYPWEFWNEIIAYKIGISLGFNVLEYVPAVIDGEAGCLSPSMTKSDEELIHGQQFLTQILPSFETKKGIDHTFQLIQSFFESDPKYDQIIDSFIEMLVFDSIIGNRDRHQQNWALIRKIDVKVLKQSLFSKLKKDRLKFTVNIVEYINFSQLFDNGNCLAYNIVEENIDSFLNDHSKTEKYLFGEKATSHVRWNGECLSHLQLLSNINEEKADIIENVLKRVKQKYSEINISNIINTIDNGVIFAENKYNLSLKRKELLILLLETRIKKLFNNF